MSKPKSDLFVGTLSSKSPKSFANSHKQPLPISANNNKLNHIFNNDRHKLKDFLKSFNNNEEAAYNKLREEYNNYIKSNGIKSGYLKIKVRINGFEITIRGVVIDGVGNIGTAYIGDN